MPAYDFLGVETIRASYQLITSTPHAPYPKNNHPTDLHATPRHAMPSNASPLHIGRRDSARSVFLCTAGAKLSDAVVQLQPLPAPPSRTKWDTWTPFSWSLLSQGYLFPCNNTLCS